MYESTHFQLVIFTLQVYLFSNFKNIYLTSLGAFNLKASISMTQRKVLIVAQSVCWSRRAERGKRQNVFAFVVSQVLGSGKSIQCSVSVITHSARRHSKMKNMKNATILSSLTRLSFWWQISAIDITSSLVTVKVKSRHLPVHQKKPILLMSN